MGPPDSGRFDQILSILRNISYEIQFLLKCSERSCRMKRFSIALLLIGCVVAGAFAEGGILVGGGMTLSKYTMTGMFKEAPELKVDFKSGLKADWKYWYSFNERMSVIAGASIESRGAKISWKIDDITRGLDKRTVLYGQVPLLLSFSILPEIVPGYVSDLAVSFGPEIGLMMKRGTDSEFIMSDETTKIKLKTLDYAALVNASITLFDKFVVGAGYSLGFLNVVEKKDSQGNDVDGGMKNSAIKMFVNYKFKAHS